MNLILKRIFAIKDLSKQRNFVPGLILGIKAMVLLSVVLINQTSYFIDILEKTSIGFVFVNMNAVFFAYLGVVFVFAGKEIIQIHIILLNKLDLLFRKAIDRYSSRYWKKNRKDPPFLNKISNNSKIFRILEKIPPRKRRNIMISIVTVYLFLQVGKFGLFDAITDGLSLLGQGEYGGFHIAF